MKVVFETKVNFLWHATNELSYITSSSLTIAHVYRDSKERLLDQSNEK